MIFCTLWGDALAKRAELTIKVGLILHLIPKITDKAVDVYKKLEAN